MCKFNLKKGKYKIELQTKCPKCGASRARYPHESDLLLCGGCQSPLCVVDARIIIY